MNHSKKGIKSKVVGAMKFFFTGDEEIFDNESSSPAKRISLEQLDMVNGGDAISEEYWRELRRNYDLKD